MDYDQGRPVVDPVTQIFLFDKLLHFSFINRTRNDPFWKEYLSLKNWNDRQSWLQSKCM